WAPGAGHWHSHAADPRRQADSNRGAGSRHAQADGGVSQMKVTRLQDTEPGPRRVAVGTFDGVHLGHRAVIRGNDTVLTFEPHPLSVVRPEATPKLLQSFAIKRDLIAGLGVEELVVIPFDREFASKTPEEFVRDVLVERLQATHVSVGENFHFGRKQA